jgi:hypothetical protein
VRAHRGWCLASLALLGGCGRRASDLPACSGVTGTTVTRVVEHPGGGHEMTVRLRFQDGVPIGETDLVRCLSVAAPASKNGPPVVSARTVAAAYTLLLVDPGLGRRDTDQSRILAEQIARRRPAGEALAIYRWGPELTQVAPFGTDRSVLLERLSIGLTAADPIAPAGAVLAAAASVLAAVGGASADALRTIVLVSPRAATLAGLAGALPAAEPHLVVWIGGSDQLAAASAALPAGLRFPVPATTAPAAVVAALSDRLDAYREHAHYGIGLCGADGEQPVQIDFSDAPSTSMILPPPMAENRAGACRPGALAMGHRAFPRRLELVLTGAQHAAAAAAYGDRAGRPPFGLAVRVAPDAQPTAATARYRADASYDCARRSYTIELDEPAPRFFFPGFAASKFHLVSMCLDRLYLRTFTTLALMAEEGLFPVPFAMLELVVDGVSQGPYLAFEEAPDSLRVHSSRVTAVMRRDDAGGVTAPQVQFSATTAADAVASFQRILDVTAPLGGQRLENALRERLDLDRYLNWVALMNLVGSGAYSDGILFYAAETTAIDGQRADYHLVMGWDQSRLFDECQAPGRGALVDDNGLLDCSRAELDRRIFADPLLYARYAAHLEALVDRQPPQHFAALVDATARRVLGFFQNPEALAGLVELRELNAEATTRFEVARALLDSERELLAAQYTARRATLQAGLSRFHTGR